MNMQSSGKNEYRRITAVLWIVFIVIVLTWIGLYSYYKLSYGHEYTYVFEGPSMTDTQEGISIHTNKTKAWKDVTFHEDMPHGAQYDIYVNNASRYSFYDWKVKIDFDGPVEFDSGWNGQYDLEGNTIYYTAEDTVAVIQGKTEKSFGSVLYTKRGVNIQRLTVTGYWDMELEKTGWFWAMVEITIIYILIVIMQIVYIIKTKRLGRALEHDAKIIEQTMKTLTEFIDAKDAYTKDHSARVAEYAKEIGKRLGMDETEVNNLFYITLMHDCGKIAVPDEILKKEGALTPEEFAIVKTHTTKGYELLKKFSALEGIGDGAHYHHERYDGYGYPAGLEAEDIPLYARIICVADAYDAMSSNRCYRKALDKEKILAELTLNAGKQFDPKFVPIMIGMIEDGFVDIVKEKFPFE